VALEAALVVAKTSRGAAGLWDNGTREIAVPTVLVWDEVVAVGGMTPNYVEPVISKTLALARHLHLAVIWHTQRPQMVHPTCWDLTTNIYLMRIVPRWRAPLEMAGIPRAMLDKAVRLKKHSFLTWGPDDEETDDDESDEPEPENSQLDLKIK